MKPEEMRLSLELLKIRQTINGTLGAILLVEFIQLAVLLLILERLGGI